jgi:DNA helicase HerA-like ATPase
MAEAKDAGSLDALTTIALEGRKFGVGLVVASQRPSRIAKDVLAQMNSQLVFRLANHEDLGYVRESFEAAGESLMEDLPQLDTGVGICAGTMVAMPVRCDVPLFASRAIVELQIEELPEDRVGLEAAVKSVLPEAAPVERWGRARYLLGRRCRSDPPGPRMAGACCSSTRTKTSCASGSAKR